MSTAEPADYEPGGEHSFNKNSPRPPVPGEETEVSESGGCPSPTPGLSHAIWSSALALKFSKGGSSPVATPRRSSLAFNPACVVDAGAPLGFEPEGRCGGGCSDGPFLEGGARSPPPYLRWARHLHSLLEDSDGVQLFRRYLEQEGRAHADTLDFWFACEGLKKQQDPEKISQLVKVIHRRFFLKTQLAISEDIRKEVNRQIKECKDLEGDVFDTVQEEVERLINETTYPNFLKSDMYLVHVQLMQAGDLSAGSAGSGSSSGGGSGGSSGSSSGGRDAAGLGPGAGLLPTLHEDSELVTSGSGAAGTPVAGHAQDPLPLTRDMLMATQKWRAQEARRRPEAYAGVYLQHAHFQYHPSHSHPAYSSYNPVSRQDSELQSLSSDARTESDNMSLTDSSVDGRMSKKQYLRHCKQMKESASMNRDSHLHHTVIPRTQRIQKEKVYPMKPNEFAAILIDKLEGVRREQEAQEKLDRKLLEGELCGGVEEPCSADPTPAPRIFAEAIREKLMVDDDNDQAILDQHVSRVWSDLTPSRSPGLVSPRPHSPEGRRRGAAAAAAAAAVACAATAAPGPPNKSLAGAGVLQLPTPPCAGNPSYFSNVGAIHGVPHPYQSHSRSVYCPRHTRKDKDVFSTFSSDSGNVHDFAEGSEHKHYMPKSKSMPDYQEAQKQDGGYPCMQGYDPRFRQSRDMCRKSSSKKTLTDLTDSGVSVVSDSTPVIPPSTQCKDNKVLSWLMGSDKNSGASHSHSEVSMSKHRLRCNGANATSPVAARHCRKPNTAYSSSRSGSLERAGPSTGAWGGPGPAQPFVADPSMPPLPLPHTATQLEEARRRLLEEEGRPKAGRQRYGTALKAAHGCTEAPVSGQSTLRRPARTTRAGPGVPGEGEFTTVVFSFCDEQFPYRTKIPGRPVTLRQFKEYLPKKGSYRFFFKTECEDLDMKVIQEEITDDNDVLPLWEGKVMAQVKPIE